MNGCFPLVSIIIPVYNLEGFIGPCLEHCIKQTLQNIEIVIVDDGSTDNSASIVNSFAQNDARIRYIYQENKGVAAARETGVRNSTSDLIFLCDGDDLLSDDAIELLYNEFLKTGADITIGNIKIELPSGFRIVHCGAFLDNIVQDVDVNADGSTHEKPNCGEANCEKANCEEPNCEKPNREKPKNVFLCNNLSVAKGVLFGYLPSSLSAKLYKKSLFDNDIIIPYEIKIGEDCIVSMQLYEDCSSVAFLDKTVYTYVYRKGSVMNSPPASAVASILNYVSFIINHYLKKFESDRASLDKIRTCLDIFVLKNSFAYLRMGGTYPFPVDDVREHFTNISIHNKVALSTLPIWRSLLLKVYFYSPYLGRFYRFTLVNIRRFFR